MLSTNRLSKVVEDEARNQACRWGVDVNEAVSLAFAELWNDRNIPSFVVVWIQNRVRRILANDARNQRRRRAKQPLLNDLVSNGEDDGESREFVAAIDHRENPPALNASDREVVADVSRLAEHPVEIRTLDYLIQRPGAPKSKQQVVAEASCSRGQAYRRARLFEKRLEAAIMSHGTGNVH